MGIEKYSFSCWLSRCEQLERPHATEGYFNSLKLKFKTEIQDENGTSTFQIDIQIIIQN